MAGPGRPQPYDGRRSGPFPGVVLVDAAGIGGARRVLRGVVRRPDPAPQRRLSGDRHLGLWRDRADRRAQLAVLDQRCDGFERGRPAAILRLPFRGRRHSLLLCRGGAGGAVDRDQPQAQGFADRPGVDGDPRGRDRRRGDGGEPGSAEALGLCHRRRLCRRHRHPLHRQIADRDPGHVHVSGVGHDPGHGRFRRHRQRMGRGGRRADPPDPAILGARGSLGLAAGARPAAFTSAGCGMWSSRPRSS